MATSNPLSKATGKVKLVGPPSVGLAACLHEIKSLTQDQEILGKLDYALSLSQGIDEYLKSKCSPSSQIERRIHDDTLKEDWAGHLAAGRISFPGGSGMMTDTVVASFLRILCRITRVERVLEIGMFTGHSAASFGLSPHVKELICLDLEPLFQDFFEDRIRGTVLEKKPRIILGPALDSLKQLKDEDKKFDLVFVDADKANLLNYYKFVMDEELLAPGGFFLIDNVLWAGTVVSGFDLGPVVDEFNRYVQDDARVEQCIVPIGDGVSIITRKS